MSLIRSIIKKGGVQYVVRGDDHLCYNVIQRLWEAVAHEALQNPNNTASGCSAVTVYFIRLASHNVTMNYLFDERIYLTNFIIFMHVLHVSTHFAYSIEHG